LPIWINVTLTNQGSTNLSLWTCALKNSGAIATVSPITAATEEQAITNATMDVLSVQVTIAPGGKHAFRVLLNDVGPNLSAGHNAGWLAIPFGDNTHHWFTVNVPYTVSVAPLSAAEMDAADAAAVTMLDSPDFDARYSCEHSLSYFPDSDAVSILYKAVLGGPNAGWVIDYVHDLCNRPRTAANNAALVELSKSPNSEISALAKANVSK
jgi:hypothetical protein